MEKKSSTKYIKYAIGEILLVVIGILIALWINNLNDKRKIDSAILKNVERIENEIIGNQKQINKVFEYHKMIRDTIQKVSMPENFEDIEEKFGFWRGHQIFRLQDAAFQTLIQSGVSQNIDAELLENLNTLYSNQTFYNELSRSVTQGMYTLDFSSLEGMQKVKNLISMTMEDVYYLESELIASYKECLQGIKTLK